MATYCVGYVRVSVDKTGEKVSPEQQADAIRSYAQKNGWEVYEIYKDIDVSGGSMDRPEFNRMLCDIQNLKIKTIVFWNLSRFTRNFFDFVDMTRQLQEQQVSLWTAEDNNNIDLHNWNHNSMYSIFKAMFAHQQLQETKATVKANFNKMVQDGHSIGAPAMFGLKKCKKQFRNSDNKEVTRTSYEYDDMEKVELVRLIYKMYTEDYLTDMEIVRFLNQNYAHMVDVEAVIKYRKGKAKQLMDGESVLKWNKSKIFRILTSTQATGFACKTREKVSRTKHKQLPESEWLWSNNFHAGKEPDFPALVDLDTWFKAQQIRKGRNPKERKGYEPRRLNSPYLLSGLLRCGCCSYAMTGKKEKGSTTDTIHHYYYCRTNSQLGAACENKGLVRCELVDDVVLRLFGNTATILAIIKTIAEHQNNNKDREANYINKLSALENRIRSLNTAIEADMDSFRFSTSDSTKRRFMESIDEKENELQKAKKEKELFVKSQESAAIKKINLHELVGMLLRTPELIADEQTPTLRRYLSTIIECVFYHKDKVVIHLKFAKRDIRVEVENSNEEKIKKTEFEKQQRLIQRVKGNLADEVDHRKLLYMLSYLWDKKELSEDEGTVLQTVAFVLEEFNKKLVEEAVPFDLAGIASQNAENGELLVIPAHSCALAGFWGH